MTNSSNYQGDFIHSSGDQEAWFKIWSRPDYLGEWLALRILEYRLPFFPKILQIINKAE